MLNRDNSATRRSSSAIHKVMSCGSKIRIHATKAINSKSDERVLKSRRIKKYLELLLAFALLKIILRHNEEDSLVVLISSRQSLVSFKTSSRFFFLLEKLTVFNAEIKAGLKCRTAKLNVSLSFIATPPSQKRFSLLHGNTTSLWAEGLTSLPSTSSVSLNRSKLIENISKGCLEETDRQHLSG